MVGAVLKMKVREFERKDQDAAFAIWKHGMSVDLNKHWVTVRSEASNYIVAVRWIGF